MNNPGYKQEIRFLILDRSQFPMLEPATTNSLIGVNVTIALLNTFFCWSLWRWRRRLRRFNYQLIVIERDARHLLQNAPVAIAQPGQTTQQWRTQYLNWQLRLHQIQQFLQFLIWLDRATRARSRSR
jgi:hypothetical protein